MTGHDLNVVGAAALAMVRDRGGPRTGALQDEMDVITDGSVAIRDGRITAAGWSPFLERGVAFVRLARADDVDPRSVEVMGFDLAMHEATIVDLPFYDTAKKIPRGLEVTTW